MFTRSYFESVIAEIPGISLEIYPLSSTFKAPAAPFTSQTLSNMRLSLGWDQEQARAGLPGWAWDVLSRYDSSFSEELRQDMPVEVAVILSRAHKRRWWG
jgi:hypothetical protein